jgi:hypothetical protein
MNTCRALATLLFVQRHPSKAAREVRFGQFELEPFLEPVAQKRWNRGVDLMKKL